VAEGGLVKGVVMGNRLAIEPRSKDATFVDAIRDELSRILESSIFVLSDRRLRFLRFTVETTLEGKADTLKGSLAQAPDQLTNLVVICGLPLRGRER
jgi:hypothetical protein